MIIGVNFVSAVFGLSQGVFLQLSVIQLGEIASCHEHDREEKTFRSIIYVLSVITLHLLGHEK